MNRRMRAVPVFLAYMAINGFFSRMMGVIFSVFLILRLGLGPVPVGALGDRLGGLVPPVRNAHRCRGRHHQPADLDRHRAGRRRRRVPAPRALAQLLDGGCLATDLGDLRDVRERRRRRVAHGRGGGGGRPTAVPPRRSVLACGSVGRDRRGRGARDREPRPADPRGRRRPAAARRGAVDRDARRGVRTPGATGWRASPPVVDRHVQGRGQGDALAPRARVDPQHGRVARGVDRGVRPAVRSAHPAGHRASVHRAALAAVVVRDPRRRCARARVRRVDRRATPGDARRSRPRRADPGRDRRASSSSASSRSR